MKWAFALLMILSACSKMYAVPPFGDGPLHDDLQEFANFIPHEEIIQIIMDYTTRDPEVMRLWKIIMEPETMELVKDIEAFPEVINFFKFLHDNGIHIYQILNYVNRFLSTGEFGIPVNKLKPLLRTGGVNGLFKDIANTISVQKLLDLHKHKMESSSVYVSFVTEVTCEEFLSVDNKIQENVHYKNILKEIKDSNINFSLHHVTTQYMSNRKFREDILDFLYLLPMEKIERIISEYMRRDYETQNIILFIISKQFQELTYNVSTVPEFQNVAHFASDSGFDPGAPLIYVVEMLSKYSYRHSNEPVDNIHSGIMLISGGFAGLIADVKTVIPYDKIEALHQEKLVTSEVFAKYVSFLKNDEVQQLAEKMNNHETVRKLWDTCKLFGFDLDALRDFIHSLFGLQCSGSSPKMLFTI